jgi:hypothetical protein
MLACMYVMHVCMGVCSFIPQLSPQKLSENSLSLCTHPIDISHLKVLYDKVDKVRIKLHLFFAVVYVSACVINPSLPPYFAAAYRMGQEKSVSMSF